MESNRIRIYIFLIAACLIIIGAFQIEFIYNYVASHNNDDLKTANSEPNENEQIIWIFNVDTRDINTLPSQLTHFEFPFFTAALNGYYASLFDYRFVYLQVPISKFCPLLQKKDKSIKVRSVCNRFDNNTTLAITWIKVRGILYMLENIMNENDLALYIDSDVTFSFEPKKFQSIQDYFKQQLPEMHPNQYFSDKLLSKKMAFVHDSRSYWTAVAKNSDMTKNKPLNSGVIFFYNCEITRVFMKEWWISMSQFQTPLETTLKVNYETQWPHEQGRLTYMVGTQIFKQHIAYMYRDQKFLTHWGGIGLVTTHRRDAGDYAFNTTIQLCKKEKFQNIGIYCQNSKNFTMNETITRQMLQRLISTYVQQIQL